MLNAADAVNSKIRKAFAAAVYPGDNNVVVDQHGGDPESDEIADAFRGKRWNEVSVAMVHEFAQALPLFTPCAFRYYLPAYMSATLNSTHGDDIVRDLVPFNLMPPYDETGPQADFFKERAAQFSSAEREAIASFLEVMMQHKMSDFGGEKMPAQMDEFRRAIDFWNQGARE